MKKFQEIKQQSDERNEFLKELKGKFQEIDSLVNSKRKIKRRTAESRPQTELRVGVKSPELSAAPRLPASFLLRRGRGSLENRVLSGFGSLHLGAVRRQNKALPTKVSEQFGGESGHFGHQVTPRTVSGQLEAAKGEAVLSAREAQKQPRTPNQAKTAGNQLPPRPEPEKPAHQKPRLLQTPATNILDCEGPGSVGGGGRAGKREGEPQRKHFSKPLANRVAPPQMREPDQVVQLASSVEGENPPGKPEEKRTERTHSQDLGKNAPRTNEEEHAEKPEQEEAIRAKRCVQTLPQKQEQNEAESEPFKGRLWREVLLTKFLRTTITG